MLGSGLLNIIAWPLSSLLNFAAAGGFARRLRKTVWSLQFDSRLKMISFELKARRSQGFT